MATDEALKIVLPMFNVKELKQEQKQILDCITNNRDCLAILPTGYGKSLPYQLVIPLAKAMGKTISKKVIVCSPLVALMKDQVDRLSRI